MSFICLSCMANSQAAGRSRNEHCMSFPSSAIGVARFCGVWWCSARPSHKVRANLSSFALQGDGKSLWVASGLQPVADIWRRV